MTPLPSPTAKLWLRRWSEGGFTSDARTLPEETPIALVHDGSTTAVMMGTPQDLEDFGVGFSLTEGLIRDPFELAGLEISPSERGVEVRMWLAAAAGRGLVERRHRLVGPVGCGLCGVESLEQATRPAPTVAEGLVISPADVHEAIRSLAGAQRIGASTRAVHAAGWWTPEAGLRAAREDVGRHNALDKLAGALIRASEPLGDGVVALTSRVSVEMIQKAAMLGAQVVVAVSAPTLLAVRVAESCGMTLAAVVRDDGFEVFTSPHRILA